MRILIDILPYTLLIAAMVARYFASTRWAACQYRPLLPDVLPDAGL